MCFPQWPNMPKGRLHEWKVAMPAILSGRERILQNIFGNHLPPWACNASGSPNWFRPITVGKERQGARLPVHRVEAASQNQCLYLRSQGTAPKNQMESNREKTRRKEIEQFPCFRQLPRQPRTNQPLAPLPHRPKASSHIRGFLGTMIGDDSISRLRQEALECPCRKRRTTCSMHLHRSLWPPAQIPVANRPGVLHSVLCWGWIPAGCCRNPDFPKT